MTLAGISQAVMLTALSLLAVGFGATLLAIEVGWTGDRNFDDKVAAVLLAALLLVGLGWLLSAVLR